MCFRKMSPYILTFSLLTIGASVIYGTNISLNIAKQFKIDKNPPIGAILALEHDKYRLTDKSYDPEIAGVVVDRADIFVQTESASPQIFPNRYIVENGEVDVLVNKSNGLIQKGDYITSSDISGQGMRADKDGLVVGIALEDFEKSISSTDLVKTHLNIRFMTLSNKFTVDSLITNNGIFRPIVDNALKQMRLSPDKLSAMPLVFRYAIVFLLIILAIVFGILLFGRVAIRGLLSLGKNPLARWTILSGVILNVGFAILFVGFFLTLSYIVLTI